MKSFVKSFSVKFGNLSTEINDFASKNNLNIVQISICERWDYIEALVLFEEMK